MLRVRVRGFFFYGFKVRGRERDSVRGRVRVIGGVRVRVRGMVLSRVGISCRVRVRVIILGMGSRVYNKG